MLKRRPEILPGLLLLCVAIVLCSGPGASADPLRTYHIGNSLTNDAAPQRLPTIAASAGIDHETGWHINGGKPLSWFLANPTEVQSDNPANGNYQTSISTLPWDAVVLQPYRQTATRPSTLGGDVAMILDTITRTRTLPENANTVFYIYAAWPDFEDLNTLSLATASEYLSRWNAPYAPTATDPTVQNKAYYDALLTEVRASTDAEVRLVPVGGVLAKLATEQGDTLLGSGTFGEAVYRDVIHLSRDLGRVIAATTFFSTLNKVHPDNLTVDFTTEPAFYNNTPGNSRLTPALQTIFADAVWSVVSTHPDTGVDTAVDPGDYNGNGQVEQGDLDLVLLNWGVDTAVVAGVPAGWTGTQPTGLVDQDELDRVLLGWAGTAEPSFGNATVPEPAGLAVLGIAGACVAGRRRRV